MKKLIGTVAALLLVASAAFAELSMGAWLRTVYVPVNSDGDETIYGGLTNSWGGTRFARVDFSMTSDDGKAGLAIGLYADSFGSKLKKEDVTGLTDDVDLSFAKLGDNVVMWVKPIDMLRVSFGKWDCGGAIRGDLCLPSWDWARPSNWVIGDEGLTGGDLCNQTGVLLELTPIDNLLIRWNLPYSTGGIQDEAYETFEKQHIDAKYTIENIGNIRLGWQGLNGRQVDDKKELGKIHVGFDLTAVENLFVTVGAKIHIASGDYKDLVKASADEESKTFRNAEIGLGASYQVTDAFKVMGSFGIVLYDKVDGFIEKPVIQFGLGLSYAVMDNLTAMADFRGLLPGGNKDKNGDINPDFSFMVGIDYACSSNGSLGFGFQGLIRGENSITSSVFKSKADKFAFAVPIKMQVSF